MFNFQKEVVINSLDALNVKLVDTPQGANATESIKKLRVRDGGEYFAKYIVDKMYYHTEPVEGVMAKIVLKPADIVSLVGGSHVQIAIELGLDNEYRGDFGSALWYFRRPVVVDLATATLTAERLADAFKAVLAIEDKPLEVSVSGDSVVLEGTDSAIKVRKIELIGFTCDVRCEGQSEEPIVVAKWPSKEAIVGVDVTRNKLEFGTYKYMIHNLRLPTYENMRFMSPSIVEAPIMGGEYEQFSFAYCVPRVGLGGMSAVGQTIHSTTLHTFFVLKGEVANAFKEMLDEGLELAEKKIDKDPETHNPDLVTILPDAMATKADLGD